MVVLRRLSFCFAFLSLLSTREARAEAPPPSAHEIAEKARRAYDLGHIEEAIDGYGLAYRMSGEPDLLFDMAEAHRDLGHTTDALRLYRTYLRRAPMGEHRERAERQIEELERRRTPPAATPPVSTPAAAPVVKPVVAPIPAPAATPIPAPVSTPVPAPVPAISSPPSSEPGVDLRATTEAPVPGPRNPVHRWIPWTLAGTTIALGAGAVVAGLSASKQYDNLNTSCGQTDAGCTSEQIQTVKSRALIANVLWGLTGAAAIATGVVVVVDVHSSGLSALWRY